MLRIQQQGVGVSVLRDGQVVDEGGASGVHETRTSAISHAKRVAAATGEGIDFGPVPYADGDILILHTDAAPSLYVVGPAAPGAQFIQDVQLLELIGRGNAEDEARKLVQSAGAGRIYLVEHNTGEWIEVPY